MDMIETKDLILKPYEIEDVKQAHENFLCQKETAKYTLWRPTNSIEDAKLKLDYWTSNMDGVFFWLIKEKKSEQVIGFISASRIDEKSYGNVGIAIGLDYINKGYGSQVLEKLIDVVKDTGAKKLYYSHFEENEASKNLALKFGFRYYKSASRVRKYDNKSFIEMFYVLDLK